MLKSECFVGQIVYFTSHGRDAQGSRGGHLLVKAVVTKVNSKNALLTEVKGTYNPGARWNWPIAELRTEEQDRARNRSMVETIATQFPHLSGMLSK